MEEYLTCILTLYTSSETKNPQANLAYIPVSSSCCICSAVLEKNMVLKSNGGKNCLRTLFPFSALGENIKNETAQIGAKTAQIGAKMAQNDTKTAQNPGNHQERWFFLNKTKCFSSKRQKLLQFWETTIFSAHLGGIVIYTHSDWQKVRMPYFLQKKIVVKIECLTTLSGYNAVTTYQNSTDRSILCW